MITRAVVYKPSLVNTENKGYQLVQKFECPPLDAHDVLVQITACRVTDSGYKTGLPEHMKDSSTALCLFSYQSTPNDEFLQLREFIGTTKEDSIPVGREISGTVVDVGAEVTQFKNGSEVTGILPLDSPCSGCATYCVLSQFDVVHKPHSISHVDAATCIGDGLKAYTALFYQAKILSGDTVLVCGGTTGHNMAAIQLAQHVGAKVIATVSTEEEQIYLNNHQPPLAQVIDLRIKKNSLVSICMEETGGLGIDCIIDNGVKMFGKDFEEYENKSNVKNIQPRKQDVLNCLAVGGRWITSQHNLQIDPSDSRILFLKSASVYYLFEQSWTLSKASQGKYLHILHDVLDKAGSGILRPVVHQTVQLDYLVRSITETRYSNVGEIVMVASHLPS